MSELLSPGGIAFQVDMGDIPRDVREVLENALSYDHWDKIPGLLCIVLNSYDRDGSLVVTSGWSTIHGYINFTLESFEKEFLPYVLSFRKCKAVRVRAETRSTDRFCPDFDGKLVNEQWTWWRGSTFNEVRDFVLIADVMES